MDRRTQRPLRRTLLTALTLLLAVPAAAFNGRVPVLRAPEGVYRGAAETAARRGWDFAPEGKHGFRLSGGGATLVFEEGCRVARLDRMVIYLNFPPLRDDAGRWYLHIEDIERTAAALLTDAPPRPRPRRILLDPGHGGEEPGASGSRLVEKDQNLVVAARVAERLRKRGFEVTLTRTDDRTVPLHDRPREIGRRNADLFVSIHQNAAATHSVNGIETFVAAPAHCAVSPGAAALTDDRPTPGNRFDRESLRLAAAVQGRLIAATGAVDRGVKRRRFVVVREADCPAILVECGFISNPAEQDKMLDPAWRGKIAAAIADGIGDYARQDEEK